jgi:circadian clock protein KaiB
MKPSAPEPTAVPPDPARYVFQLFVIGTTPNSTRALVNARKLFERHLAGRYELEVIDLVRRPHAAGREQVIAAPTLIKKHPLPLRRFIGDLGQADKILAALEIRPST